jgi:hypothetical protein
MAATVTILTPRTGDTVGLTVTVSVAYAGITTEGLTCTFGGNPATPTPNPTGDGLYIGAATTTAIPTKQTAIAQAGAVTADQMDVNVASAGPPMGDIFPVMEKAIKGKQLKRVRGKVPDGSTATKVVCTVKRVDAKTGTITEVGSGESAVTNKHWDVKFGTAIDLDDEDYIQYFVCSCAYDGSTPLGCVSTPIDKKK